MVQVESRWNSLNKLTGKVIQIETPKLSEVDLIKGIIFTVVLSDSQRGG
jgi:hypothetical protein